MPSGARTPGAVSAAHSLRPMPAADRWAQLTKRSKIELRGYTMKLDTLSAKDRLQLLKFVCSFVWADLDVRSSEKTFVLGLTQRLDLPEAEIEQVTAWLETPPPIDEVDPLLIPPRHRRLFLEAMEQAVVSDGSISPSETESLALFRQLLE
jgi:uncharacterized tellurite resistance protein B-like protein